MTFQMAGNPNLIPIGTAARLSYGLLRKLWISALLQNIGVILVSLAFSIVLLIGVLSTTFAAGEPSGIGSIGLPIFNLLLYAAAYLGPLVMLFVGLFRMGMFGIRDGGGWFGLRWSRRETRVLLRGVLIGLMLWIASYALFMFAGPIIAIFLAIGATPGPNQTIDPRPIFLGLAVVLSPIGYLAMRFSLYVCAPAVDDDLGLRDSWALTRGNGWRMFAIGLLVVAPVYLLNFLFTIESGRTSPTAMIGIGLFSWIISVASAALWSFMMAVIYDYMVRPMGSYAPSAGQTPSEGQR